MLTLLLLLRLLFLSYLLFLPLVLILFPTFVLSATLGICPFLVSILPQTNLTVRQRMTSYIARDLWNEMMSAMRGCGNRQPITARSTVFMGAFARNPVTRVASAQRSSESA